MGAGTEDPWLQDHPAVVEWWGGRYEPSSIDPNASITAAVQEAHRDVAGRPTQVTGVPYRSDMALLVNHGATPAVLYGPGDVRNAHVPDEFVPIDEVLIAARSLALTAMRFCGVAS